jgi:hypothetical protein
VVIPVIIVVAAAGCHGEAPKGGGLRLVRRTKRLTKASLDS